MERLMTMNSGMDDWQLIQSYVQEGSEAAFTELVGRHIHWVRSVALRRMANSSLADEVAQAVFVLLAKKARDLRPGTRVGGWLFRTACHVAAHAARQEMRRKVREVAAHAMKENTTALPAEDLVWQELALHLDDAVAGLSENDRSAILLRFYEKKPLREVGERLGVSEEAAKKRVNRALEKMRAFLHRRGVGIGAVALSSLLADRAVEGASAELSRIVVRNSIAVGTSASVLLPRLGIETLRAWRLARIKLAASIGVGFVALLVGVYYLQSRGYSFNAASLQKELRDPTNGNAVVESAAGQMATLDDNPPAMPRRAGALTGLVVDERGKPIADAIVWGGFEAHPFSQDKTDATGWFALDKLANPPFVTVTASGFAADQQMIDPGQPSQMLMFRLTHSVPLRVRIVDEAGNGLSGARVFFQQWWGKRGTLGQKNSARTDAAGYWRNVSPPKGELILDCSKTGYRYSRTNRLSADGSEHVIVLHPAVTLTGSVTDSETSEPIRDFAFTTGHSQPWVPSDPIPMWDYIRNPASNGFYKTIIEEEQVPFLRVEADGYQTIETEIFLTNGLAAVQDFQLKRRSISNSIRGVVLLPNGAPAAGVEVALCTATAGVMLNGVTFEPEAFGNLQKSEKLSFRRTTDEFGSFLFDSKPGAHTLVAVSPEGIGKIRCFDHSQRLELRLQAWGRVQGNVRSRDRNWADRKVRWSPMGTLTDWMTLFFKTESFSTDENGGFVIERVPPGTGRVCLVGDNGSPPIWSPAIEVRPGQTAQLNLGGNGVMVIGRLVAPAGADIRSWTNQVTFAEIHTRWDPYPMPRSLTGDAVNKWKLEFADTEAGRAWLSKSYAYRFPIAEDGTFSVPEVLPGEYYFFVNVARAALGSGTAAPRPTDEPVIANGSIKFSVPILGDNGAHPQDLGKIILRLVR